MTISGSLYAEEEISAIKFTDFQGHIELRYWEDEYLIDENESSSTEKRTSFEQEIFLSTSAYIYHPNFLKMELGFGPLLTQADVETDTDNVSAKSSKYNLSARFSFLEEKPYPLVLYYNKDYPTIALTLTDRFQQESEKVGFDFKLNQPVLPFNLGISAFRQKTQGLGFDIRIDDTTEQKIIRANIPMGVDGYGQLIYNSTDLMSQSGFVDMPATTTNIKTDTITFDSRILLGADNQYQLNNAFSYTEQSELRPLKELRYTPELRWTHSEDLVSYYRLGITDSDQVKVQTSNISAEGGFRYKVSDLTNIDADLHIEDNRTTGLRLSNYGISGNVNHKRNYSFGGLNLSAGWNYDYFDQQITSNVPVRDLRVNFQGITPQFLPHNNIISSSIRIFRIFGGGETELEVGIDTICGTGVDILVTSIGARIQIENCNGAIDGNIITNIDYDYDPGGTYAYANFVQSYQANLTLYQYSNLYLRWRNSNANISSGTPTLVLDESTNTQIGTRFDYPVYNLFTLGGEVVYEKEDGTLISFDREALDAYVQFSLFKGRLRLSSHRTTIDYLNTREDVALTRQAIQLQVRPWNKFTLTFDVSDEEDVGGITNRRSKIMSLKALWRIRSLIIRCEARMVKERYNINYRDRSQIRITMRRDF